MHKTTFLFLVLCSIGLVTSIHAQRRPRPLPNETKSEPFQPVHFIGGTVAFNGISGVAWESTMKSRKGGPSRSTFLITGGYSSRFTEFKIRDYPEKVKTLWVHGLGASVTLNNYIKKPREGMFWGLGMSAHYFFLQSNSTYYSNTLEPFFRAKKDMKMFSVNGQIGYRIDADEGWLLSPAAGLSLMGTPLKGSSSSRLSGLYAHIGIGISKKH